MLVAIDVDNVLADIISSARLTLAEDLGIDASDIVLTNAYHQPFGHPDPAVAARLVIEHAFWDRPEVLSRCPVIPGSLDAVLRLEDHGILAGYVTRRPAAVRGLTEEWMASSGFPDRPRRFVGTTDAGTAYDTCKSIACRELGATHLVDDHADEFSTARAAGIEVVVVDADIGRDRRMEALRDHPDAILVASMAQAADLLIRRSRLAA
jgi:hypothetical protein